MCIYSFKDRKRPRSAESRYAPGCESLDQARIPASSGILRTGVGTEPVGECTGGWGEGIGIQSAQERIPTPVPSDDDEEEMTPDQIRWTRRFRKGRGRVQHWDQGQRISRSDSIPIPINEDSRQNHE
jgi:hypothetical protein